MLEIAREGSPQQVPFNRSFLRFLYRFPLTFYSSRNAFGYGTYKPRAVCTAVLGLACCIHGKLRDLPRIKKPVFLVYGESERFDNACAHKYSGAIDSKRLDARGCTLASKAIPSCLHGRTEAGYGTDAVPLFQC